MCNICLVSDFFHPKLGGVEMHIFALAITLQQRGHKVIVITNQGLRQGVKYISGIKVYYAPFEPIYDHVALFTVLGTLPFIRQVLIREKIHIVHSHSATSYLGNELLLHAQLMGYKTVFTDHSLFAFNDTASFHVNKILKFILTNVSHCISVSHLSKENLSLRASLDPQNISVIPNAVDCSRFKPDPSRRDQTITIVVLCRLAFRKGVDLLVDIIPEVCAKTNANFIIGGDGPKRRVIEDMISKHNLNHRVKMLGGVPSQKVRDVLTQGHIFLNTSLTEAFCIAIVEAASCGLIVVSTDVGGVSEVLPSSLVLFAKPQPDAIISQLLKAIDIVPSNRPFQIHQEVNQYYNWQSVAERTEQVYKKIIEQPNNTILQLLRRATTNGPFYGIYIIVILVFDYVSILLLDLFYKYNTQ